VEGNVSDELKAVEAAIKAADYKERSKKAAHTGKWAVTMAQVRMRQAVAHAPFPHWNIVSFEGQGKRESTGIVDLIAIRKDHASPRKGVKGGDTKGGDTLKRGDTFQIILIQVKGGSAAWPTAEDGRRLREVKRLYHARNVLLASWKKGTAANFHTLRPKSVTGKSDWTPVEDLQEILS
jgi:hypothetical protein